jgi:hypothetical protein
MAAKKKKKVKKKVQLGRRPRSSPEAYGLFMNALLSGVIHAVRLYESSVNGTAEFEVDEEMDDE